MVSNQILVRHAEELSQALDLRADVVEDGPHIFVIVRNAPLPLGLFQVDTSDILLIADQQYPLSAMDMFWTEVEVIKADDSIPQGADAIEHYLGRPWRRFSWHRNGIWKPTGNPLLQHYATVEARWVKEANR